jgi:hypothetical protein
LKEEALDRILWRTRFGRGYGPVVRQTTEWCIFLTTWATVTLSRRTLPLSSLITVIDTGVKQLQFERPSGKPLASICFSTKCILKNTIGLTARL